MTEHDVLVGFRLRLFTLAEELGNVSACRAMGVHRSTYYRLKRRVDRWGSRRSRSASAGGHGCRTRSGPTLSSGSWPSRWATLASGPGASRPSSLGRSGVGSGSQSTASGASCGAWG
jgi:hypothetical protein